MAAGCNDFVRKPFYAAEIFRKMTDYLGVQFELEASGRNDRDSTPAESVQPTLQAMQQQPLEWRQHFHQAAIQADSDWLRSLLAALPEEQVRLKQGLNRLIIQLDFETLMALTETVDRD